MSRYWVSVERRVKGRSGRINETITVEASSESQARSIAKEKSKIMYPGQIIAVLEARKL